MTNLLFAATTTPSPSPSASAGGGFDLFGVILWPLKWVVELILVAWHWLWTTIGLDPAAGLTWVLSIVGLVVVVRAALVPLMVKQIKSQRRMMEIAPELRKVQDKYRGKRDQLSREAMSRETMALYKKHGTNPVSGCLPILVQMPIFFSLFSVLRDVKMHAEQGVGGVGLLDAKLTQEFYDAKLFGVASLHDDLVTAWTNHTPGWQVTVTILVILVVLMIASQFITQLQIISKNLSPEAKTGQAYQMQKVMLYVLPFAFVFSGVFFPLGVVVYWFISNLWTMAQQFIVIRNMPTPGSEAHKARDERLRRRGKGLDAKGNVVTVEALEAQQRREYEAEQQRKAELPKRQQPMSKQRAKKQAQRQPTDSPSSAGDAVDSATDDPGSSDGSAPQPKKK